ncbi:hypothetical protein [Herbaspirillum sp. B65]|uniref:hypothetical protein n=1 Tax=Herbaspirillum sp. B65 TaxID=137708 RepID=UPI0020901737|nr:hypothetical protein [Herbaspirillum sp. B65]
MAPSSAAKTVFQLEHGSQAATQLFLAAHADARGHGIARIEAHAAAVIGADLLV